MTKTSSKVISKVAEFVENKPISSAAVERRVTHYVGSFVDTKNAEDAIKRLQSNDGFPNLKYINHRPIKDGKRTEVWLSTFSGEYTINKGE